MKRTQFRKGALPHNTLHDGAERVRVHKGRAYTWVRIALGKWREMHKLKYEMRIALLSFLPKRWIFETLNLII